MDGQRQVSSIFHGVILRLILLWLAYTPRILAQGGLDLTTLVIENPGGPETISIDTPTQLLPGFTSFDGPFPEPSETKTTLVDLVNVPPEDQFVRGAFGRAEVLGDYIYLEGQMVSQKNIWRFYNGVNATLAINLTDSWSTDDVAIIELEYESGGKQTLSEQLWQFDPTTRGAGEWTDVTPKDNDDIFFTFTRTKNSAYASTPSTGFIFGGYTGRRTTREQVGSITGYSTFDFKAKKWSRFEDGPYSTERRVVSGRAVFAPELGPDGLIFIMGGIKDADEAMSTSTDDYTSFNTIHFIDPVTKKWYSQETTGQAPPVRYDLCAVGVGVKVENSTRFDIFIYGGYNQDHSTTYSTIHVLSLPAFHWTTVASSPSRERERYGHDCAVVGRRQLLSLGGVSSGTDDDTWESPDPFPQGIGIFDMSSLQWTHEYDANADSYEQHRFIKAAYDDRGEDDVDWSSPEVRRLFFEDEISRPTNSSDEKPPDREPPEVDREDEGSESVPVGAIAGGVVGGVVFIAAIGAIFWFLRRRRRSGQATPAPSAAQSFPEGPDTEAKHAGVELYVKPEPGELPAGYLPPELVNRQGTQGLHEMHGTSVERDPAQAYDR